MIGEDVRKEIVRRHIMQDYNAGRRLQRVLREGSSGQSSESRVSDSYFHR